MAHTSAEFKEGCSQSISCRFLSFSYSCFRVEFCAVEPVRLPLYKGSTLRGAFGHSFRAVACSNRHLGCQDCGQKYECAYSYVFETPPPPTAKILKKYPHAPHPFIIDPPLDRKDDFLAGDNISYHLILIGEAIKYLPVFILTFERMGERGLGVQRGRFELRKVFCIDGCDSIPIYSSEDKIIHQESVSEKTID